MGLGIVQGHASQPYALKYNGDFQKTAAGRERTNKTYQTFAMTVASLGILYPMYSSSSITRCGRAVEKRSI